MKRGVFIFWSLFITAALFRLWQSFYVVAPDIGECLKQNLEGVGTVVEEPERKENGQVLVVSVDNLFISADSKECPTDFLVRMKTKLYPRFSYEDHISFKGKLLEPAN